MVLLDTHAWIWWVHRDPRLTAGDTERLEGLAESDLFFVSAISLWEVAKLVEKRRLQLYMELDAWLEAATSGSAVGIIDLTPDIAVESTRLPGDFHSDPADQIIVATARVHACPLVTADGKIRAYPHVSTIVLAG